MPGPIMVWPWEESQSRGRKTGIDRTDRFWPEWAENDPTRLAVGMYQETSQPINVAGLDHEDIAAPEGSIVDDADHGLPPDSAVNAVGITAGDRRGRRQQPRQFIQVPCPRRSLGHLNASYPRYPRILYAHPLG